jgi:hypothetical protein
MECAVTAKIKVYVDEYAKDNLTVESALRGLATALHTPHAE